MVGNGGEVGVEYRDNGAGVGYAVKFSRSVSLFIWE